MKFTRYLLSLCAVFLLVVVVSASAETEEAEINDEVVERNPLLLRAAVAIIRQAVKWAAKHCAEQAANNCKQHWKNPRQLVSCAKHFLQANKGRCVSG